MRRRNTNTGIGHHYLHATFLIYATFIVAMNILNGIRYDKSFDGHHHNHNIFFETKDTLSKSAADAAVRDDYYPSMEDEEEIGVQVKALPFDPTLRAYLEPEHFLKSSLKPLPSRNVTKNDLTVVEFPQVNSCERLTSQFPIDEEPWPRGVGDDWIPHWSNSTFFINRDPFLPWIHDVFPIHDSSAVRIVAQNKRRCHTGDGFEPLMEKLEPQMALFQGVPIQRKVAVREEVRYKLSSLEDADEDAKLTRFVCNFKLLKDTGEVSSWETLSYFLWNYEAKSAERSRTFYEKRGKDNGQFWLSTLVFDCPIPQELQSMVQHGFHLNERSGYTNLFVDIIPIRTPPRNLEKLLLTGENKMSIQLKKNINTDTHWGKNHILPRIKDSGRWENVPVCAIHDSSKKEVSARKKHKLVACTWTSASYKVRGRFAHALSDGEVRLREWITFHLLAGFDHIYIYDNSKAFDSNSSLVHIVEEFSRDAVTHIDWPCKVCNNLKPAFYDPGERSSQYAAETSCLNRYGPTAEWVASFDIDEYIVPNNKSIKSLLEEADKNDVKILTFGSMRAKLRMDYSEKLIDPLSRGCKMEKDGCLTSQKNATFLQAYNCEQHLPPKPKPAYRAQKQIFRADHVLHHYVHYSTITKSSKPRYEQVVDEAWPNSATLIHSKGVMPEGTKSREKECKNDSKFCSVAYPWPKGNAENANASDESGFVYNCHINDHVDNYWVPLLEQSLTKS